MPSLLQIPVAARRATRRHTRALAASAALLLALQWPGLAQASTDNLITNGSFESGLSGWLASGGVSLDSSSVLDGNWAAALLDSGSGAALSWTLASALATADIGSFSLWLRNDSGPLSQVVLSYSDGTSSTLLVEDFGNSDWVQVDLLAALSAGQTLTGLTVQGNTTSVTWLDGVTLQTVSAVPEPATWLLVLGGCALMRRRQCAA